MRLLHQTPTRPPQHQLHRVKKLSKLLFTLKTKTSALTSLPSTTLFSRQNHHYWPPPPPPRSPWWAALPHVPPPSTQNRLNQAWLILQYQELNDHYDLCWARLIDLLSEAESLRHENAELRLANAELLNLLSSQASFHNLLLFFVSNYGHCKEKFFLCFFFLSGKFWAWNDISLYLLHCLVGKKVRENRKEKKIFFYLDF